MILAVLDDPDTTNRVVTVAEQLGMSLTLSRGGRQLAEELGRSEEAWLLVLDVDSPIVGGVEALQRMRPPSDILLMALGNRRDGTRVAAALRAGADCYLPKPVEPELLKAQIEALRRRLPQAHNRPASVTVRGLTVDFARKEVRLGGEAVAVTPAEYRLLACLASRPGKVVSSSELLREMSGYDCSESEAQEIVKVHVSRLRNKIDRDPSQPGYLLNVRGFGYLLERRSRPSQESAAAGS